jgi:hypothetical protein
MTFLRSTTVKLLGLVCIWFAVTRLGSLFINPAQSPAPDPLMEIPVTVAPASYQVVPVSVHFTEKADASLRVRLGSATSTDINLLVFDEGSFARWRNAGRLAPLYHSNPEIPCDVLVRLAAPLTLPREGVRNTYYVVFANRRSVPKSFQASVSFERLPGSDPGLASRALFVGLILVGILGTMFAALRTKRSQPEGDYALPPARPGGRDT